MFLSNSFGRLLMAVAIALSPGAFSNAAKAQPAKPAYETTEVAPGLYSFGAGMAFNAFMITGDGVVVMDSFDKDFAKASLQAIRKVTDQPIKYLIYSHSHYDHISGGEVFRAEGATILSHEAAANWLKSHPSPDVAMPDKTWSGSRSEPKLGRSQINLLLPQYEKWDGYWDWLPMNTWRVLLEIAMGV